MSEKPTTGYSILSVGEPVLVGKRHGGKGSEDSLSDTYSGAKPAVEDGWSVMRGIQEASMLCNLVLLGDGSIPQTGRCTTALGGIVINAMRAVAAEHGCVMEISFPDQYATEFTFRLKDANSR